MKTKLLAGLFICLGLAQAKAQTISAPVGQNISITNSVDVTGDINIPTANSVKLGGAKFLWVSGNNQFIGTNTANSLGAGTFNTAIGASAGFSLTSGNSNFFLGSQAGYNTTTGSQNFFIGVSSGLGTVGNTSSFNVGIGNFTGYSLDGGTSNLMLGTNSGQNIAKGNSNVMIGTNSGRYTTGNSTPNTGSQNIIIGGESGTTNTIGSNNILIGYASDVASNSLTEAIAIGSFATVATSNSIVLGNKDNNLINVGIGVNNPANKLEIFKSGASGLRLKGLAGGGGTAGRCLSIDNNGDVQVVGCTTTGLAARQGFEENGAVTNNFSDNWTLKNEVLFNKNHKGVVIGTGIESLPEGYSFYVADGILTEKVKVAIKNTDEWADYVFSNSYKRPSLNDVEKYISINKHLPNVPSAAEMVSQGNDLHKTDVKLLEKIEELTLYMIEMEKRLSKTEKENAQLKKALKARK